jgi:hypothetical protein
MRSTILVFATALVLAGCSMMPAFVGGGDAKPTVDTAPPAKTVELVAPTAETSASQVYEIQHTTRGPVRRVKVLLNGRTVETLNMSRSRETATSHCCNEDGCETIEVPKKNEPLKACTSFKMVCDAKGACKEDAPPKASIKS